MVLHVFDKRDSVKIRNMFHDLYIFYACYMFFKSTFLKKELVILRTFINCQSSIINFWLQKSLVNVSFFLPFHFSFKIVLFYKQLGSGLLENLRIEKCFAIFY